MDPVTLFDADSGVTLSVPTMDDVPAITAACQAPEIQYYTNIPSPYQERHAIEFVTTSMPDNWKYGGAEWAIRRGDELVGMICLTAREPFVTDLGYWIAPQFRGQGLLDPAISLAIDFGFGSLGLRKINWMAVVDNWGSWRVAWRHGFIREGVSRAAFPPRSDDEPYLDLWIASLLPTDARTATTPWDGPEKTA